MSDFDPDAISYDHNGQSMWLDRDGEPISVRQWEELRHNARIGWLRRPYFRIGLTPVSWLHPTRRGGDHVSTVWLGINMRVFPGDHPEIFETMVFGGPLDGETMRYATAKEAKIGHKVMVHLARAAPQAARDRERTYTALSFWWSRRRHWAVGLLAVLLCGTFLAGDVATGRWGWVAVFSGLLGINLWVMTYPWFRTFRLYVKPAQEGRDRFREDHLGDPWLSPDAARWQPPKELE